MGSTEEPTAATGAPQGRLVLRRLGAALTAFFVVWVVLFVAHRSLPGIQSGSDQVVATKRRLIREAGLFPADANVRVAVFGDSRVLAGFRPDLFEQALGSGVAAYNLGLPGIGAFVPELEVVAAWEPPPTHVLLAKPWKERSPITWWALLHDDKKLMERVFPFRHLPRDALLFFVRSRGHGGPATYYRRVLQLLDDVERDRGYHFIESQSRHKGHRLPDDFRIGADDPNRVFEREVPEGGPELERILELKARYGFEVVMVPTYFREGAFAPPNKLERPAIEAQGIDIVGPDYWLYPPRLFSDVQHLNRDGAEVYTRDLARLVRGVIVGGS
jgi:hypothetical protein